MRYLPILLSLILVSCGRQETTQSALPFLREGYNLSAHRYIQRYFPGTAFEVTCNGTFRVADRVGTRPCTIVFQNPRRVTSLICDSSDVDDTTDHCYISGSF